jgi:hypothetical protein
LPFDPISDYWLRQTLPRRSTVVDGSPAAVPAALPVDSLWTAVSRADFLLPDVLARSHWLVLAGSRVQ